MYWYQFLERQFPGITMAAIAKKLVCDEIVWEPLFSSIVFFAVPLFETKDLDFAKNEWNAKFLPAWSGSAVFWFAAQGISFRFIPVHYRVLYQQSIGFIYDVALATYRYQF